MDYKTAGVDIETGDQASQLAYKNAKATFPSRAGLLGEPVKLDGGFSGALDMGDFYLIQNDDGVGTKMEIAERMGIYNTLGADLVAMVADDAICVGAEVISLTNTVDTPKVEAETIDQLTKGLSKTCQQEKIVIPGGEIAELGDALNKMVWNATAVGVAPKDKFITGKNIKTGQKIIGLKGRVLRSNGTSLARKICEQKFGSDWHLSPFTKTQTWGEVLLTPSKIFHRLLLDHVLGSGDINRPFNITGVIHVTGGGIPGNFPRVFPNKTLGAKFDNLHAPHEALKQLKSMGKVADEECYRSWHCGTAMGLIVHQAEDPKNICEILNSADNEVEAQVIGEITTTGKIELLSRFSEQWLTF
jgi:phosphoribosylformylglycinamidine cyclo-ligase